MTTEPDTRGLPKGYPFKPRLEITPIAAHAALESPNPPLVIDVRTREEFELVQLPNSLNIPLHQLEDRLDEIEPEPGQVVITLCHHGVRSLNAALYLQALGVPGLENVRSIAGGLELWSLVADPAVPRYERGPGLLRLLPPTAPR